MRCEREIELQRSTFRLPANSPIGVQEACERGSEWPVACAARGLRRTPARGLRIAGVVVSHTQPGLPAGDLANLELLRASLPVRLIGELPFGARELVPAVDLRALLDAVTPH